jgi:peptidoglycan/LPS O-acetylase OafA/YrhL
MHSLLSITWSLSVEEQFYIVVPTVVKYARRVLPFLLPLAYVLVCLPSFSNSLELRFLGFFGPILLGAMLALVLDEPRGFSYVSRVAGWRFAPVVALGLMLAAASHPADDISGWPRLAVHWAMLALIASCVVRETNALAPLLSLWPMRRIGRVSYGIYLYHHPVMYFVLKALSAAELTSGFATFVGTTLATWIVAELSYRLFEQRFLALKARYGSQTAPAGSQTTPSAAHSDSASASMAGAGAASSN